MRLYYFLTHDTGKAQVFAFDTSPPPLWHLVGFSDLDVACVCALSAIFGIAILVGVWLRSLGRVRLSGIYTSFVLSISVLALFSCTVFLTSDYRALSETDQGLDSFLNGYLIRSFLSHPAQVIWETATWAHASDVIFIVTSLLLAIALALVTRQQRLWRNLSIVICSICIVICGAFERHYYAELEIERHIQNDAFDLRLHRQNVPPYIRDNALYRVLFEPFFKPMTGDDRLIKMETFPSAAQLKSVAFIDPLFAEPAPEALFPALKSSIQGGNAIKNVIFFIIESGSAQHMLEPGPDVMPFTSSLVSKSVYFPVHYTSVCFTTPAITSMFTGLYPGRKNFDTPGWRFPTLFSLLANTGRNYSMLWVTNNSFQGFFPSELLTLGNPLQVWDNHNLPLPLDAGTNEGSYGGYLTNHARTLDFFIEQLRAQESKGPVAAVFNFYSTHYPYYFFPSTDELFKPDLSSNFTRYQNGLHAADALLKRLVQTLESDHVMDSTLLVITGDHGESFGAHPFHGTQISDDVVRTPLILYNPRFAPFKSMVPTSHTDILPTVLDALDVSYDATRFQGESLLRGTLRRRYVMASNYASDTVVIGKDLTRLSFYYGAGRCEASTFPSEETRPCDEQSDQFKAGLTYRKFINSVLNTYNNSLTTPQSSNQH